MGWYRRSKLVWDTFRNAAMDSKILARNPIPPLNSIKISRLSNQSQMGVAGPSLLLSRFGHLARLNHTVKTPILDYGRRFYRVDRHQVYHFRPRGYKKRFEKPNNVVIVVLLGSGCVITLFGDIEIIPYKKRTHIVLLSRDLEKQLGEFKFKQLKGQYKGKILPDIHPDSVKVRLIAKDVIDALQTQHLDHVNWEVLVIDNPNIDAFCLPGGGKIVVFTGLLKHFKTDVEIATVISHEVGHVVARHGAELITKNLWLTILHLILYPFVPNVVNAMSNLLLRLPNVVSTMSNLLLRLSFLRKMEIEADYIGVLLMASAGYDPRAAPSVYEKHGQLSGDSAQRDYLSTHPSGKRRAQLLAQAQVMQEAMNLYRERISGHGIEGFP